MSDVTSTIARPAAALLDTWADHAWNDGLQLDRLSELDELLVRTRNNVYRIVAIVPSHGEIIVQGGRFFPEPAPARLAGCSLGGAFLKQRGIYVGFRMEIQAGLQKIVTSDVQSIAIVLAGRPH